MIHNRYFIPGATLSEDGHPRAGIEEPSYFIYPEHRSLLYGHILMLFFRMDICYAHW